VKSDKKPKNSPSGGRKKLKGGGKRRLTAAEKRARRERKRKYTTILINGKQKRVPRPVLIEGLTVDQFIAQNADPIWLHQNGMWELLYERETKSSIDGDEIVPF
jgi:hypothetical protein